MFTVLAYFNERMLWKSDEGKHLLLSFVEIGRLTSNISHLHQIIMTNVWNTKILKQLRATKMTRFIVLKEDVGYRNEPQLPKVNLNQCILCLSMIYLLITVFNYCFYRSLRSVKRIWRDCPDLWPARASGRQSGMKPCIRSRHWPGCVFRCPMAS